MANFARQRKSTKGIFGRLPECVAAGSLLTMVGCTAPGMKMDDKPSSSQSAAAQPKVNLHTISPQLVMDVSKRTGAPSAPAELTAVRQETYIIGAQDVLLLTVWDHPEISLPLGQYRSDAATGMVVDERGDVFFPYVGTVRVAGRSVTEVRALLTEQLATFIRKPQVDVKVISFRSKRVFIGGEVRVPSVTNLTDVPLTLAEAIHRSGGFQPNADDSHVVLVRGQKAWTLDYSGSMAVGNGLGQIILQDGDTVYVPNLLDEPVYMMGEVNRPGLTQRPHGRLSLARALSESGGISGTSADARSIYVLRQAQNGNEVDVFHLDGRNPAAMVLADRFPLQARDVVYVDAGTLVRFGRVMGYILPTVSAVNNSVLTAADYRYMWNRRD